MLRRARLRAQVDASSADEDSVPKLAIDPSFIWRHDRVGIDVHLLLASTPP
jgi:hypothetical protein